MLRHLSFALALFLSTPLLAAPVQAEHVEADLVAENSSFQAGAVDNWVALRLRADPGWHVYWQNPGDSGIATQIEWTLPAGVSAGPLHWPYPHRQALGELTNYGYEGEALHLVPIRVSREGTLELHALAKWLVCKDICIPGEAALRLPVNVTRAQPVADSAWAAAFAEARAQLPQETPGWEAQYTVAGGDLSLSVSGRQFPPRANLEFFPLANDLVAHAAPQRLAVDATNGLRLSQKLSAYFVEAPAAVEGVLVVAEDGGAQAYRIVAQAGEVAAVPAAPAPAMSATAGSTVPPPVLGADPSLFVMLAFAMLGGLLLNLMPCVFPVLAIKALSLMKAGAESAATRRAQALAYTAGVVLSFVAVAGLLMALRAGGAALGWGFQLQSPGFVFALTALIFAMGLSLSGVAQFGASWMGAGQSLAARPGLPGAFFTGVLAVIVASPCTAPFMAPALGFALAQSTLAALLVFAALGLGLALPFLLIGLVPRLAAWLPRPGAWMESFKQWMAFPLYLTAVWLLWVLGGLTSRDGMALALVGLVGVALAVWLWGRARGGMGQGLALAVLVAVLALALHPALRTPAAGSAQPAALAGWEPYSDARFDSLRAQGHSVFVDFTADWCLTCKLNERGAMRADSVREAFRRHDVKLLVGDWTRADPAITAVLQRHGRSGVPLYLASREGADPVVLPQILTPEILISAFE